jgi:hypothetical protein
MIVCTRCGASNQPTSKFCLSCGNALAAAAPPPAHGAPSGQQPQQAPPPPAWAAPPGQGAAAPAQYGGAPPQPPWQPPAPQAAPGYGPPAAPAWNTPAPADGGTFAPAAEADRARFGSPEGMNPFGATVSPTAGPPPAGFGAPPQAPSAAPYGPPPGYGAPPYAPPPAAPYAPPPPAPYTPPPAAPYAAPPAYQPPAPVQPQWAPQVPPPVAAPPRPNPVSSGPHSHDPSAFAATAPPPTTDEHEAQIRRSQAPIAPSPSAPPLARSAPPPTAVVPLGPGRDPELVEAGAIRALAGFLVSYDQSEFGVFWPIYQGQNVLGRKGAGAGLDIEIDSPTTSSRHAVVYASARPGRLKVEDSGSTNGTFLNEAPIERGKKFELRDNDTLRFGGFNVIVKII